MSNTDQILKSEEHINSMKTLLWPDFLQNVSCVVPSQHSDFTVTVAQNNGESGHIEWREEDIKSWLQSLSGIFLISYFVFNI